MCLFEIPSVTFLPKNRFSEDITSQEKVTFKKRKKPVLPVAVRT